MKITSGAFLLLLLLIQTGCKTDSQFQHKYQQPEARNDGLEVASLQQANMEKSLLEKAISEIHKGKYGEVHSMLIYKNNALVLEQYFPGHTYQWDAKNHHGEWITWNHSTNHAVLSVSKSITSACIGIAIAEGYIKSPDQSIFDYLPGYSHLKNEGKERITIEHLLTMTSGLAWDEWSAPPSSADNDIVGIWLHEDPIAYILEKQLEHEPGTSFTYSGGNMILLGEILHQASGMPIDAFSKQYLFEPMGIDSARWVQQFENGVFESAGGLEITPREMMKIGILYLNQGVFEGQQLLPEEWVKRSGKAYGDNTWINIPGVDSGRNGYAYGWWVDSFFKSFNKIDLFFAGGWGGQKIIIIPELNTVVVFTGGNFTSEEKVFRILHKYIIAAME